MTPLNVVGQSIGTAAMADELRTYGQISAALDRCYCKVQHILMRTDALTRTPLPELMGQVTAVRDAITALGGHLAAMQAAVDASAADAYRAHHNPPVAMEWSQEVSHTTWRDGGYRRSGHDMEYTLYRHVCPVCGAAKEVRQRFGKTLFCDGRKQWAEDARDDLTSDALSQVEG